MTAADAQNIENQGRIRTFDSHKSSLRTSNLKKKKNQKWYSVNILNLNLINPNVGNVCRNILL